MNTSELSLQERNALRAKEAIAALGDKYLCHPSNQIKKKKTMSAIQIAKKAIKASARSTKKAQ